MVKTEYKGTKGLKSTQALKWIEEVHTKYSLNDSESTQIQESIEVVKDFLNTAEDYIEKLEKFKEYGLNKLSKKDLAQYLEEEYLKR